MRADLHLHTTASDGSLSPREVVWLAASRGLQVIAITDHDSVAGVGPALAAAQNFPQLTVIPGVEINTDIPHGEVHVLGYFIDYLAPDLRRTLSSLRISRRRRAQKMVAKLRELGIFLEWGRVLELAAGESVGRPHLAQAMLEKGYISSFQEAFTKYIGRNGPAYALREKMTPAEAVALVARVGGLAVLAHPREIEGVEALLPQLKEAGLVGLEAYYNGYSPAVVERFVALAEGYGLTPTGGSDYHGLKGGTGSELGSVALPSKYVERLLNLAQQRQGVSR